MAKQLFSNNAETTVGVQLAIAATSLTVATGAGAKFSSPTGGDYELITLIASNTDFEVVKMTARSGDVLTIERGVEGTARQWEVGETVSARVTKATMEGVAHNPRVGYEFQDWYETHYEYTFT